MKLRSHRPREEPDIILVNFIDVLLMLLIFFIITTTFDRQSELGIRLPQASAEATSEEKGLEISIDAQGRYFVNGEALPDQRIETLKDAMQKAIAGGRKPPLTISADGRAQHQFVVGAMDAAAQLGFERLSIQTRQGP
jgi:biopolymer transport protein ExbD